eukprot:6298803-Alexandrium_andersonii.AAC.1
MPSAMQATCPRTRVTFPSGHPRCPSKDRRLGGGPTPGPTPVLPAHVLWGPCAPACPRARCRAWGGNPQSGIRRCGNVLPEL